MPTTFPQGTKTQCTGFSSVSGLDWFYKAHPFWIIGYWDFNSSFIVTTGIPLCKNLNDSSLGFRNDLSFPKIGMPCCK
jgi:hypothetical protein